MPPGERGRAVAREKPSVDTLFVALVGGGMTLLVATLPLMFDIAQEPSLLKIVLLAGPILFVGAFAYYYLVLTGADEHPSSYWHALHERLRDDLELGGGF